MKKLLDSKFLFILGLSVLMLIVLVVGAFYLFNDSDATFVKSGYVLNPLSSKTERYFFDKDVSYHENLSSLIEFKDVDDNEVTVDKDSFLHYDDGSLSLLKNGAILDLDSINGKKAVSFYNITSKSIIDKKGDGYVIETNGDDIELKNFIARINDNKYIFVGNFEAKIPGNNVNVPGEYFEVVYVDNGVVNIENKEVKYQVTAEGTQLFASGLVIDLGDKKISQNGEDVMSLTAITINGDENVEIIPKVKPKEEENGGQGGNGQGENTEENNTQEEPKKIIPEETLKVSLKEAQTKSTTVKVKFEMENAEASDQFMLRVTNLESGVTVDKFPVEADRMYDVPLLSPNTKYLFTVVNSKDNEKYYQKIFETEDLGIKLEKNYATDSGLEYKVTVDKGTDIDYAALTLYKFDEDEGKNVPVMVKKNYIDDKGETVTKEEPYMFTFEPKKPGGNIEGEHVAPFYGLDSDTIYTAVLSDFSILTKNFSDIYDITLTSTTLKKKPDFSNPIWSKDEVNGSFKLSLSNIEDPDNAITSYTYSVYNYNLDGTVGAKAVTDITKSDATPIQVMVGTSGGLELSKKYVYKAVIEYYDNEKYLELVTSYSDKFSMDEEAFVTLIPDDETMENNRTSYNRIGGTIYLTDNSCLIKMQSRTDEGCPGISNVDIQIMIDNPNQHNIDDPNWEENNQKYIFKTIKNAEFTYDNEGRLQYSLDVPGLKEHTFYLIRVINNDTESGEPKEIKFSSESATGIWTKKISTFDIVWADGDSNDPNVINAEGRLVANDNGEVSVVESVNSIKRIDVEIYEGNYQSGVFETNELTPIVPTKTFVNTNGFNLKEKFYDKAYNFTNGMFGLTLDDFKDIIDANPESDYYFTLYVKACYDTACNNPISITKDTAIHPYLVNRALFEPDLGEFVITEPVEIPRGNIEYYQNLENEDTTVGFRFTTSFDNQKLLAARYEAKGVRISVYKEDGTKVGFYVIENNSLIPKDKDTYLYRSVNSSNFGDPFEIYLDPDTSGEGNYMHRGSEYYIVYEVETISKSDVTYLPVNRTGKPEKKYSGTYQIVSTRKEEPVINLHIAESTSGSVTYEYDIKDADHALVKEDGTYNLYYDIDGTEYSLPIDLENSSSGEITIPNLNQGDYYAIYTKINLTGNDVKRYPDVSNHTKRLFESEYTLGEDNIRFKVIPSQLTDNKVTIKLLAEQNLLNRVLIYKVYFRANGETILKEFAKLGSCGLNNTDVTCLSVGYDELRAMRSQQIDISIKVAYDTGLTGFDYIGRAEYMILQQHNTGNGLGYYIGFTSGNQPVVLDETYSVPKGYYMVGYVNQQRKDELNYTKIMDAGNVTKRITSLHKALDGDGIVGHTQSGDSVINPKVVRLTDVNVGDGESKNFYFDSYTPTIDVKIPNTSYLINGTSASIRLFGADYNEFCEESSSDNCVNHGVDGAYYIHVDVYERDSNTQVGNYKFKIEDNTKINQKPVIAKLDKLRHSTDYYFNVYVFLNKDGRKEPLQLYDNDLSAKMGDFTTKNYDFTSLTGNDLVQPGSITINSIVKSSVIALRPSANYGDRVLDTKFTLKNYEFNYDLEYVLCDAEASTEVCNNSTLRKTINSASIQGISVADYMDLPDDLDYSKRYVLYLYAIYKSYNDQDVRVLIDTKGDFLDTIEKPTFNIERKKAMFDNGESYIDITVHVDDSDERLIDGKYKVQLPLFGETVSQGNMYVSRDNGLTFEPVDSNTEFSVEDTNLMIRVRGLTANTKYEIIVNGRAYLDDHDQEVEIKLAKDVVIYSADASGTALGETANIEGANGIVTVTLFGGSNADNVTEVYYTIGEWGGYLGLDSEGNAIWKQNAVTQTGHYVLAESNNGFSYNSQTADLQYKIAPVTFANGASCQAVVRFKTSVQDPDTGDIVEKWIPFSDYFVYGETG